MSLDTRDISRIRELISDGSRELGVKLEMLEDKMNIVLELLSKNLKVSPVIDDHEKRLISLEADGQLLKSTVALHSKKLAA